MNYQVFDNGKPADYRYHKVDQSWNNSTFTNFEDALKYAINWLGYPEGSDLPLVLNIPFDYGYGAFIEIREIQ